MHRIESHLVGIDRGSVILFSDFEDGGEMWTGNGPRVTRKAIAYSKPYMAAPIVHVSLSMWDMSQKTNSRADISAEEISATGFFIVFRTWGDTQVARVRADWLSIGKVRDEDDWDVV